MPWNVWFISKLITGFWIATHLKAGNPQHFSPHAQAWIFFCWAASISHSHRHRGDFTLVSIYIQYSFEYIHLIRSSISLCICCLFTVSASKCIFVVVTVTSESMCTNYWLTCPGKSVIRWADLPPMTIAVDWNVKQHNKQTNKTH